MGPVTGLPPTTTVLTPAWCAIISTKRVQAEEQKPSVSYPSISANKWQKVMNEAYDNDIFGREGLRFIAWIDGATVS
jgi:hypothetical protein